MAFDWIHHVESTSGGAGGRETNARGGTKKRAGRGGRGKNASQRVLSTTERTRGCLGLLEERGGTQEKGTGRARKG